MPLSSRNESLGFAERTKKNLDYIENAFERGEDVHVVTQIVNSLLGLIVFPWEASFDETMKVIRLDALDKQGWPLWTVTKGNCSTLGELIRHLRNAASHRNLKFSSDSRNANQVKIEMWDQNPKSNLRN